MNVRVDATSRPWVCSVCSKSFTRPDLLKRHEKIHDKPAKGKASVAVGGQQIQGGDSGRDGAGGKDGSEEAASMQVKARSTSADIHRRDDDGRLPPFAGRLHTPVQGHHSPMMESTLAAYPYNRIVSPVAGVGSTSPRGRKEMSSMRFESTREARDRNESYERGSARGYYRDERETSNGAEEQDDVDYNGRAGSSGEPSRKRARVSSSSLAARRHESPGAADGRTVYAGLALPVHKGIAIGGTTLPSLSEGILMHDMAAGDNYDELQGDSSSPPNRAMHTVGKGKGVAASHRDPGFAYPGYDTGHVMMAAGDVEAGTSRTPYDSRETSPVHAATAGAGKRGDASTTLVGGYDSTLPSAGLEALSAADIRAGLTETGRNRRRRGEDDGDLGLDEKGSGRGLGPQGNTSDLAARMGNLAPRRHAGMGSLGSLINAYDTTVVGVAGGAGGVSHMARDRRVHPGDVTGGFVSRDG